MASPTQWTWVWVNSGSWWWTGRPGVRWFMGLQRVGHDWEIELSDWLGKTTTSKLQPKLVQPKQNQVLVVVYYNQINQVKKKKTKTQCFWCFSFSENVAHLYCFVGHNHVCMLSHVSRVWFFGSLQTLDLQAPLSMGFSRQECWAGLPCPLTGDVPNPEIKPASLMSPHWQEGSLPQAQLSCSFASNVQNCPVHS